jgi:hypothetical protein
VEDLASPGLPPGPTPLAIRVWLSGQPKWTQCKFLIFIIFPGISNNKLESVGENPVRNFPALPELVRGVNFHLKGTTDMKRNMLAAVGITWVLAFSLSSSQAQNDAPPPGPAPAPNQPSGIFPGRTDPPQLHRLPPPRFGRQRLAFSRTLSDLRMAKMELQHSSGDLGGHKDSAMQACDKAIEELTAAMKALPVPPPPQRPMEPPSGINPPPAPPQAAPPPTPPAAAAPPGPPQP